VSLRQRSETLDDAIAAKQREVEAVIGPDPWQTRKPPRWKAWTCAECEGLWPGMRPIQPHHRPGTMIACDGSLHAVVVVPEVGESS
jgi:hypothetical protein